MWFENLGAVGQWRKRERRNGRERECGLTEGKTYFACKLSNQGLFFLPCIMVGT